MYKELDLFPEEDEEEQKDARTRLRKWRNNLKLALKSVESDKNSFKKMTKVYNNYFF